MRDFLAERDVAAVEDEDDAVERDGAALLAQVPEPREVVVGRIPLDLRRRRVVDLRERLQTRPPRNVAEICSTTNMCMNSPIVKFGIFNSTEPKTVSTIVSIP